MFRISRVAGHIVPSPPPPPQPRPKLEIPTENPRPKPTQDDLEDALQSDPLTHQQVFELIRSKV